MYLLAWLYDEVSKGLVKNTNIGIPPATGNPVPVSPDTPVVNDREKWNYFYDDSDYSYITLKVYNITSKIESKIQIFNLDFSTGEVKLLDNSVKTAVITQIDGKNVVVLQESTTPVTPITPSVWTDDMLKKDVLIKIIILTSKKEVYYKYSTSRGQWLSDDKDFNLNNGYVKGIENIVAKLYAGDKIIIAGYEKTPIEVKSSSKDKDIVDAIYEKLKK